MEYNLRVCINDNACASRSSLKYVLQNSNEIRFTVYTKYILVHLRTLIQTD